MKILCTEITQFFTNCLHVLSNGITLLVYIPIKFIKLELSSFIMLVSCNTGFCTGLQLFLLEPLVVVVLPLIKF